jgi:DNA-entry nuclease
MKVYKRLVSRLLPALLAVFLAAGCGSLSNPVQPGQAEAAEPEMAEAEAAAAEMAEAEMVETAAAEADSAGTNPVVAEAPDLPEPGLPEEFSLSMVPDYSGSIWADVNEDVPFFDQGQMDAARRMTSAMSLQNREADTSADLQREYSYQAYGDLDALGRCTGACALVGPETLPQQERGQIGMIRPTGWHTVKYDGIDGNYLYNRCHLIGFQLTGQDANEKNLITGTRSMNVEGMLPYEDSVLAYVRGTGNHVLYRVTPVFQGKNLLADGVLMEACSVEDPLVRFCAFCYNVQPGITIDYATGESSGPEFTGNDIPELTNGENTEAGSAAQNDKENDNKKSNGAGFGVPDAAVSAGAGADSSTQSGNQGTETLRAGNNGSGSADGNKGAETPRAGTDGSGSADGKSDIRKWKYIVNVNSLKFHLPGCLSVEKMSSKNMQGFNGTREELIEMGYTPCKNCRP